MPVCARNQGARGAVYTHGHMGIDGFRKFLRKTRQREVSLSVK